MKSRKHALTLVLVLAMLLSLAVPGFADRIDVSRMPGHEVLAKLPETLQRPARPTTLEQAEGRVNSRMVTVENEEEQKEEYRAWYRDAFGEEAPEEEVANYTIACPIPWTLSQNKQTVFEEMVRLTDSLTAGKTTDTEKMKAIFDWVVQNVKYDYTAFQYAKWQEAGRWLTPEQEKRLDEAQDPFYVYAQKLGVCGGQAALCWLMSSIAEIPVAFIVGESGDQASGGAGPHGWNAAMLDGRWLFFDATWNKWDMAPNYHNTTEGFAYCDGVFQVSDSMEENSKSYWLCPGFTCPESVVVPEGVFHIMAESYKNCTTLKTITLPSTLTSVETEAFMGCTGLESITIPASVQYVHWRSFKDCASLKSVTFQGQTEVREGAFDGTPMVEDAKEFAIVGGVLVKYKGSAQEITIPSGVTAIAEKAFSGYTWKDSLHKVVIPEGVVSIGESVFSGFRFLRDVTIPKSVTAIGGSAFHGTEWLKNQGDWPVFGGILLAYQGPDVERVTVPDGVREISNYAFYHNGSNIRSITFPASLKKIGHNMLSHSYLEEVTFQGTEEQWNAVEIVRNGCTNWVLRDEDSTVAFRFTGQSGVSQRPAFTDVPAGEFYTEPVAWAVEKGITVGNGDGSFGVGNDCKQEHILTFLWRSQNEPEPTIDNPYSALNTSDYYAKAAIWAYEKGLITDKGFDFGGVCTRGDVVSYLWKLAGSPKTGESDFTDVPANADYAQAVAWAVENGITSGIGNGQFDPDGVCTRGQIVTFLYRAYQ